MKSSLAFQPLLTAVEFRFGRKISAPSECSELSRHIFTCIHITISDQTLRRFFGFIKDGVIPSKNSVSVLLQYCGFTSMEELVASTSQGVNSFQEIGGIRLIKEFYSINLSAGPDFNYQKACGNIARRLLQERQLLNQLSGFLSKSKVAQIYFFERHPYIDGLCTGYEKLLRLYAQEKKTPQAQLFSACLLHLGAILADDLSEARIQISRVKQIESENSMHPFIQARRIMAFLLQAWIENDREELTKLTDLAFREESKQPRKPLGKSYFPFFQFILADAFNIVGDYESSIEMIKIASRDYKRENDANIEDGYYECLILMKAISLYYTEHHVESLTLLKSIENSKFIFICHDYFLIQRKILELQSCVHNSSSKGKRLRTEIEQLIYKTGFNIFRRRLPIKNF